MKFMKKVFLSAFAFILTAGAFAQSSSTDSSTSMNKTEMHQKMQSHDGVIMKDGKLLVTKNGQAAPLTENVTLNDGTIVTPDGTVKKTDGTTVTLKEGDYVTADGKLGNLAQWKKQNETQPAATDTVK